MRMRWFCKKTSRLHFSLKAMLGQRLIDAIPDAGGSVRNDDGSGFAFLYAAGKERLIRNGQWDGPWRRMEE